MDVLVIIIIFLFIIISIVAILKKDAIDYPYYKKKYLLSKAERSFYGVLSQSVNNDTLVFAKVRIADVVGIRKGTNRKNFYRAFNRITNKHFDFVLADKNDLSIKAVIELDDKSHNSQKSVSKDKFVNNCCDKAGLKIIRFKASNNYSIGQVKEILSELEYSEH